jgi:hypothetical protein
VADSINMDFAEFDKLAANLEQAPREARVGIRKAAQVTAGKVRVAWQGKLAGTEYLPHLGRAITFEVTSDNSPIADITAEIGPVRGKKQAAFSHLSEFGSSRTPGRGYGLRALEENADDFEYGIGKAIDDPLGQL